MPKNESDGITSVGIGTGPISQSKSPSKPTKPTKPNVGVGTNKVGVGSTPTTQSYNTQSKK
jgi:hypothetical protein